MKENQCEKFVQQAFLINFASCSEIEFVTFKSLENKS